MLEIDIKPVRFAWTLMGFSLFQSTISYSFRTFLRRFLCSRLLRYQETNWVWTQPPQSSEGYMKNNNTTPCKYSMVFLVHHRGLEPRTHWLRVSCSTNWANGAKFGSPSWTRTNDPAVNSRMLYRLSYWGLFVLASSYCPGPSPAKYLRRQWA